MDSGFVSMDLLIACFVPGAVSVLGRSVLNSHPVEREVSHLRSLTQKEVLQSPLVDTLASIFALGISLLDT